MSLLLLSALLVFFVSFTVFAIIYEYLNFLQDSAIIASVLKMVFENKSKLQIPL